MTVDTDKSNQTVTSTVNGGVQASQPSPAIQASVEQGILAGLWIFAGAMHFVQPGFYLKIMPSWAPWHRFLNLASGAAEIAGGAAVLAPKYRRLAGRWMIATLIGVYPATVHVTLHPDRLPRDSVFYHKPGPRELRTILLWLRMPLQFVAGWWVWRATKNTRGTCQPV